MAVSPFTYDLYLQMRSESHMDLVSTLALLNPNRGRIGKSAGRVACWRLKLLWDLGSCHRFAALISPFCQAPMFFITVLVSVELHCFDSFWEICGCLSEQCPSLSPEEPQWGSFSLFSPNGYSYHESGPHENAAICIFIELVHLMPILLDLLTVWYLNSSRASQPPVWVTCKYKIIHKSRHYKSHSEPWLTCPVKSILSVSSDLKNLFDKWTIMQICSFGDVDPCRWKGRLGQTEQSFVAASPTSNPCNLLSSGWLSFLSSLSSASALVRK